MLDHRQAFAETQFCSFNPAYQLNSNYDGTGDIEFDFWGAQKTEFYEHFNGIASSTIELQAEELIEDGLGAYSPPLWRTNSSRYVKNESSPLLPHGHHYRNLSPRSRKKAIQEGRRELLEMIRNMPESCFELSLRDLVDEQHIVQEAQQEMVSEERSFHFEKESEMGKKKERNSKAAGHISRSGSMHNETSLIKMFFPSIFGTKKNPATKVSRRPSFEESKNPRDRNWWKKRFVVLRETKNSSSRSTDNINSSSSRHADCSYLPGCWPFSHTKRSRPKRDTGCIF